MSIETKANTILEEAKAIATHSSSWSDYANALFNPEDGIVSQVFDDEFERQAFYDTEQYDELYSIMGTLMGKFGMSDGGSHKSGRFLVRIPKTLHEVLDVEAKSEGVSLNQLVMSKLSWPMKEKLDLPMVRLVRAYSDVFDGYASDRIICDPAYNDRFLSRCRDLGLTQSDYVLNHAIMDNRKSQKKPKLPKATKRTEIRDQDNYRYASEIAIRVLQRTKGVSLDNVLCDPVLASEFDVIARSLCDEQASLKLRWAALNLRKTHQLKPMDLESPEYDLISVGPIRSVNLDKIPELQGTYAFYDGNRPVFAGETSNLRNRIAMHQSHSLPLDDANGSFALRYFAAKINQEDRLRWLRWFINHERPLLNYQYLKAA